MKDQTDLQFIEETIDNLWELYDNAKNGGNTTLADELAGRALLLISKLPENKLMLSTTKH